jgi:hypothetical protein
MFWRRTMTENLPIIQQQPYIELTKNAKGNYQWVIKILSLDINELEKINMELENKFGKIIIN